MPRLLMRYATPTIIALFLVSLISGLALFFHIGPSAFHGIHEWLSLVLIVPFVLHVWRNWRPMMSYMKGTPLMVSMVVSVLASAVFFLPMGGEGQGGRPAVFGLAQTVMQHSAVEVAPALGTTPEALVARLEAGGFAGAAPDRPLTEIAAAAGKTPMELAAVLSAR